MCVDKSLMQRKDNISSFQSSVAETQAVAGKEAQPRAVSYRASHAVMGRRCKFLSRLPLYCKSLCVLLACIFILSTGDAIATQAVSPAVPVHVNSI